MDKQRMTSGKEELKRRNTEDMSLRRGQERWLPYSYFRSSADCTILLFRHWSLLESGSTELARGHSRVFLPHLGPAASSVCSASYLLSKNLELGTEGKRETQNSGPYPHEFHRLPPYIQFLRRFIGIAK
jgi:hypothetical protein